jgi:hypothetical protein
MPEKNRVEQKTKMAVSAFPRDEDDIHRGRCIEDREADEIEANCIENEENEDGYNCKLTMK